MVNSTLTAIEVERNNRIEKSKLLQIKGNNPYTEQVKRDMTLRELSEKFEAPNKRALVVFLGADSNFGTIFMRLV